MTSVLWPNGTRTIPHVTSEYGPRVAPLTGASTFHRGIDLSGFPVNKSPVDGVVTFAGLNGTAGIMVVITAGNGDTFMLAHNARLLVSKGQRVLAGQDVGVQGMTGVASGVHCHFEIRPDGGPAVNPRDYMAAAISLAGLSSTPIIPKRKVNPVLSISRVVRKGVGEFIMYASATTVTLTPELSANPDTTRREFEFGVAKALAAAVGLGDDYEIPTLDDSPNGGWYLRDQLAAAASGMPAGFALAPGNPYRATGQPNTLDLAALAHQLAPLIDAVDDDALVTKLAEALAPQLNALPTAVVDEQAARLRS